MKSLGGYKPYEVAYIDGMNLVYRNYYGMPPLTYKGRNTVLIYAASRLALDLRHKNPGIDIRLVWEGKDSWRKTKYPTYKANRHTNTSVDESNEFFGCVDTLKGCLEEAGITQMFSDTYEADDVVATMAPIEIRKALYSSGDWDWWELAKYGDILYQHNTLLTESDMAFRFRKKFKADPVPPDTLWIFKVLTGDTSDTVSGIPFFPKKLASELCNIPGVTVDSLPAELRKMGKDSWADKLVANKWLLEKNSDLLRSSSVPLETIQWVVPSYTREAFGDMLMRHGMESLHSRLFFGG